jgi:hypothetical protein
MFTELAALRDALKEVSGVNTCKIGFEENISPADYPIIRIIPTRLDPGSPYNQRTIEVGIVFGVAIAESQGLETLYEELSDLEEGIIAEFKEYGGRYTGTVTDEDRLSSYKLMQVIGEIKTERPGA